VVAVAHPMAHNPPPGGPAVTAPLDPVVALELIANRIEHQAAAAVAQAASLEQIATDVRKVAATLQENRP
jgi:methyl-accepting chemotaxis protein